jgi:hypothetical protein
MPLPSVNNERKLRSESPAGTSDIGATLLRLEAQMSSMNDNQKLMNKKLDEKVELLNKTIDDKIEMLRADLNRDLLDKKQHNEDNIDANANKIFELENKIDDLQEKMEADSKAADIIVRGVPYVTGENYQLLYSKISAAIGFCPAFLPRVEAFRLGRKKPGSKFDPAIIMKFPIGDYYYSKADKSGFFKCYLSKLNLNLTDIGFEVNRRVYLAENLTSRNQEIYSEAQALRKDGKIHKVRSKFGNIYIERKEGEDPAIIRKLSELI